MQCARGIKFTVYIYLFIFRNTLYLQTKVRSVAIQNNQYNQCRSNALLSILC